MLGDAHEDLAKTIARRTFLRKGSRSGKCDDGDAASFSPTWITALENKRLRLVMWARALIPD